MYCNRCNAYNDDNAHFCNNCGAELAPPPPAQEQTFESEVPPIHEQPFSNVPPQGNFNGGFNNSPFSQPMYRSQPQRYTNTLPIVAIVASILNFNIVSLILSILSLSKYNSYEAAMRMGDFISAEMHGRKSRTYSIVAIVLSIASIVLRTILCLIWVLFAGEMFMGVIPELFDEFYYDDYPMMISAISMITAMI